ncbi:hypothetical protein F5Y17DRAFT_468478 [Xylariaceae sp. FL0594]|nr:hypothetical protein F5Y17DRAFT_468478 [Xylariaceae sp. FL0594]
MPGGVCAVLDYEPDMMADYVADMATRVVMPRSTVTSAFRKFVHQILTSTRLPSTTIMLGMNYLAKHINMHKHTGVYNNVSEGELWKMLTVALLLGSKFLDDNTFQNRSWSDVSSIAVAELNTMESKWLADMEWNLYVNLDRSPDYEAWLKSWEQYREGKRPVVQQQQHRPAQVARERLAPIVTSLSKEAAWRSHHPLLYEGWSHEEIAEHEWNARLGQAGKMAYRPQEGSWPSQYQNPWVQAPLTPPDSGYGTPEYLNSAASANSRYMEWFNQALANQNFNLSCQGIPNYSTSRNGSSHYPRLPYLNHSGQKSWDCVAGCNCSYCLPSAQAQAPFFHAHGHTHSQAVMA